MTHAELCCIGTKAREVRKAFRAALPGDGSGLPEGHPLLDAYRAATGALVYAEYLYAGCSATWAGLQAHLAAFGGYERDILAALRGEADHPGLRYRPTL